MTLLAVYCPGVHVMTPETLMWLFGGIGGFSPVDGDRRSAVAGSMREGRGDSGSHIDGGNRRNAHDVSHDEQSMAKNDTKAIICENCGSEVRWLEAFYGAPGALYEQHGKPDSVAVLADWREHTDARCTSLRASGMLWRTPTTQAEWNALPNCEKIT